MRDFRDIACSVVEFSRKRGVDWSRPPGATTDADYVRLALSQDAEMLLRDWRERADRAHLVRYEDLLERPEETLEALFSYLGIDASPATAQNVLQAALADSREEQREHRTSATVAESVGRWRRGDGLRAAECLPRMAGRAARGLRLRNSVGSRPPFC